MSISIPQSVTIFVENIERLCKPHHEQWAEMFKHCFTNTLETTVSQLPDNTTFVLTGDIPAMWLRDSSAQVRPYLVLADQDLQIRNLIAGLVERQCMYITIDAYANAFNQEPNGHTWDANDQSNSSSPWNWERKYELDSLCYPIQLAWLLYKNTNSTAHFTSTFTKAVTRILDVFSVEQHHENSPYFFIRDCDIPTESLTNHGKGSPVTYTGMIWSGFRPSDDACTYHYLVPSNMFASVILDYIAKIYSSIIIDTTIASKASKLREEILQGLRQFATTTNTHGETIWAYEVDGFGNSIVMDDSNVPSLLAAPYLGFCDINDPLYQTTRATLLSKENPYFYSGAFAQGIGSAHTPPEYVWPIALAIQGLTAGTQEEKSSILDTLVNIDAGTHAMHEGVNVNNPQEYTRPWFSWSNMMFCELVMDYFDIRVQR